MSKVFEFKFNPLNNEKEVFFDTFCFLPKTKKEKTLGSLYLIGETNNRQALVNLKESIKDTFFKEGIDEALNKANIFLNNFPLTNLNFACISVSPDCVLKFSKIGNIKIILLREEEAFDVSSDMGFSNSSFPNIIEGTLQRKDKLLVLTHNVFSAFKEENILEELTFIKKPKEVKQIFKEKKKIIKEFSGACLLSFIKKKRTPFQFKKNPSYQKIPFTLTEKGIVTFLTFIILLLTGYLFFK